MAHRTQLATLLALMFVAPSGAAQDFPLDPWTDKVDPWVLEHGRTNATEFMVFFEEQADLSAAADLPTKQEKGAFVHRKLTDAARQTQAPLLAELEQMGVEHRSFWVANMIWVRGGLDVIQHVAERPDVAHVYANPAVRLDTLPGRLSAGSAPTPWPTPSPTTVTP